jgi:protease IV
MSQPGPNLPPSMPPVYFPPQAFQAAVQPSGSFARAIFTTLAIVVFGASLSLNGYLLLWQNLFGGDSSRFEEHVLTDGDVRSQIAVVKLEGVIHEQSAEEFGLLLDQVQKSSGLRGLVVQINSPGGTVTASEEVHARLARFRSETSLPVYVSMGEIATSGGYFAACAADRVFAYRTTWTGNIGVLLPRLSLAKLGQRYGVEDQTIVSTGATFKHAGSAWKDATPEQTAYLQSLADEAFVAFKDVVAKGRKFDQATIDAVADGKVISGENAKRLKLVDDVGTFDDAVAAMATARGISRPQVVRYEKRSGLLAALGGSGSASSGVSAKVGQAEITLDRELIEPWMSQRPLYLWRGP